MLYQQPETAKPLRKPIAISHCRRDEYRKEWKKKSRTFNLGQSIKQMLMLVTKQIGAQLLCYGDQYVARKSL